MHDYLGLHVFLHRMRRNNNHAKSVDDAMYFELDDNVLPARGRACGRRLLFSLPNIDVV